ncbi:GNAT family N-acetyltransferase [Streptomyces sp. RM1]|uniref:GNAT family N-acetyltransferase n=1 Tax=Streptomyces misionensis TaxID=67331 RepID=UPI00396BB63F
MSLEVMMPTEHEVVVRPLGRPGDLGWVVMTHGELYHREFGWDAGFEALVAGIVADYARGGRARPQAAWIAEVDGVRAGSVFCMPGDDEGTARLRLLQVTAAARGLGLGSRLVRQCLDFARDSGYKAVTLWTNDVQKAARRVYEAHGFALTAAEPHHSFGHDLVGQTWRCTL